MAIKFRLKRGLPSILRHPLFILLIGSFGLFSLQTLVSEKASLRRDRIAVLHEVVECSAQGSSLVRQTVKMARRLLENRYSQSEALLAGDNLLDQADRFQERAQIIETKIRMFFRDVDAAIEFQKMTEAVNGALEKGLEGHLTAAGLKELAQKAHGLVFVHTSMTLHELVGEVDVPGLYRDKRHLETAGLEKFLAYGEALDDGPSGEVETSAGPPGRAGDGPG